MSLDEYRRKRDFKKTAEPQGKQQPDANRHRFVIQKHAASRLHYDFRLELDGTLKSWAVPKGIPYAKGEKHLAVQVEDHPVSYIDFEGIIPKGQYGGGTVMVWDQGTFETTASHPSQDLNSGKLHFTLAGKKLHGEWYLVRLRDGKQWLLIRGKSDMKPVSKKMEDISALSGKTMQQLAKGTSVWQSNRPEPNGTAVKSHPNRRAAIPLKYVEPMKARLVDAPPPGDWVYEVKLDGFRAIALKQGEQTRLLSRNEKDLGEKFPEIVESMGQIDSSDCVVDGEIVALDAKGRSSFQLLQAYELGARPPIIYYVFDLLSLNGENLQKEPLVSRKAQLEKLLKNAPETIRYSASLGGEANMLLKQASRLGLEGLIGKQKQSVYEPGRRSGAWIKLKLNQEQEFVIGGFTPPEGTRQHFGALLVGYYKDKQLRFAGKVGTGFNESLLKNLYARFEEIGSRDCPFVNLPEERPGRSSQGLTASAMRKCHWVQPILVCQIKFSEWTRDGKLRQPVFLGLREDKNAIEVTREMPK